ncbi:MAG: hypothetical protein ACI9YH_000050 [Colwellia sp.]|jgi:hypothetical protein
MQITSLPIETYKISRFDEPYLHSVNSISFEKNNTKTIFDNLFQEKIWDEGCIYIILGTDSGLLVNHIIEHGVPYNTHYIFIELPEVLECIKTQLSFTEWNDSIVMCTLDEWQDVAHKIDIEAYLFREKVIYTKSLAALDCFHGYYNDADSQLSLEIESIKFKTSVNLSKKIYYCRQIENLSENIVTLRSLLTRFSSEFNDKTCIILAGGPSLDENIDWVKKNQNNIIIFCVSRVINKLLLENITPHVVLSVDPYDVSFDVSKELLSLPESVLFIHSYHVVPTLIAQWHGNSAYFGQRVPWEDATLDSNVQLPGPTVTNAAISAAIEFGFKNVLLAGVDLCYANDGRTYASGSNESEIGPVLNIKSQWVETYSGQRVETSTSFLHATYILSKQGREARKRQCNVINLSPNSAKIDYIAHIKAKDINLDKQKNVKNTFTNIPFVTSIDKTNTNKKTLKKVDKLLKKIKDITIITKQALLDNEALYKKHHSDEKKYKLKIKLDKSEKNLNKSLGEFSTFIKKFGIYHFIKVVRTDVKEDWSDDVMEKTGQIYYQSFLDTIIELTPHIIDARNRIITRIEEEKCTPDIKLILKQWQKDKQYGRAIIWKKLHVEQYEKLSNEDKSAIEVLSKKHQEVINNKDTAHFRRTQSEAELTGINSKANTLFNTQNLDGLEKLSNGLKDMIGKKENAEWLFHMSNGYLQTLRGNSAQAFESFEKISDDYLTEKEAIHITRLALELKMYDKAEVKLKQLYELSDTYATKYAQILKLNNKIDLSLTVYNEYIEENHQDIKAWLDLGKLYLDIDATESAKIAFECILQLDAENIEAKHFLTQL